jgi:parallel beta helix pectate lyase-like protein
MKTSKSLVISLLVTLTAALPALAVPRVFVSGLGNDANPGSITSPKRSFASALTVTDPGGEIIVLDSAGYGPVTINKAVSIISPTGVYAGVTVTSGDGITVSAGASDKVILRGLTISGAGGANGINITSAGAVHVESCVVSGMSNTGIVDSSRSTSPLRIFINDTIVRENSGYGIDLETNGVIMASIDRCRAEGNGVGVQVFHNSQATIRDSVIAENGTGMLIGFAGPAVSVETCAVSHNESDGINLGAGTVRVSNSIITDNGGVGFHNFNGTFDSRGNNTVQGNAGGNTAGTITVIPGT